MQKRSVKGLYEREGTWYYRKVVPTDLQNEYPGRLLRGSLDTKDKREAERRLHAVLAKLDAEFQERRKARQEAAECIAEEARRVAAEKTFLASPAFAQAVKEISATKPDFYEIMELGDHRGGREPTREEAIAMLDEQSANMPEAEREIRIQALMSSASIVDEPSVEEQLDYLKDTLARIQYERTQETSFVSGHYEDGTPMFGIPERYVNQVRGFLVQLLDAEEKKLKAQYETLLSRSAGSQDQRAKLGELLQDWLRERKPAKTTESDAKGAIRHFEEVNGALPYADITPQHIIDYKNHLIKLDKKSQTKRKYWGLMRAIFNVACSNQKIKKSPFEGVSFNPPDDSVIRQDLSRSDLAAVFSKLEKKRHDWWLFRLCLYTGARLNEVFQLDANDIQNEDGVTYINFTDQGAGQSLKTKNSRRAVPVHKQLLSDGFLDMLPKEGRLFTHGNKSAASKRLNTAIDSAGVKDESKAFHSLRHTFKSACRAAGLDEDTHDRLTGHKSSHVGRSYGTHSIAALKVAIDKVAFGIEHD
ncbi:DUF6538 domain-containing protein (plasmid) [Azospirillum sp. A29]|uniref:DUF6538 domain-containing protein n=1 Tax=Azospirillum sp. A29 TaxID=3160606 RepID=UPI00366DF95D